MPPESGDRVPKGRQPIKDLSSERILALAGVSALLIVGLVILIMIASVGGGDDRPTAALEEAVETATPTPTATAVASPTPEPLTPVERKQRSEAAALVRGRSFEVIKLSDYNPRLKLTAIIGRQGDNSRLAFFFVDNEYIGNDATEPSAKLTIVKQTRTQATLAYGTYAPDDKVCCPTGGPVKVRFRWNGTKLEPRDPIPPPEQRTPSRRRVG